MPKYIGQSSANVYFRENDLTITTPTPSLGTTVAGLVGETVKGPAFQEIPVTNFNEFRTWFGDVTSEKIQVSDGQSDRIPRYELGMIARSFLGEASNLYVVRVLGLSGYQDQSPAFTITTIAGPNIDTLTLGAYDTLVTGTTITTGATFGVSGATTPSFIGVFVEDETARSKAGSTWNTSGLTYVYQSQTGNVYTYAFTGATATYDTYADYDNMAVAVLRSRGSYINNTLTQSVTGVTISGADANPLGQFTLTASTGIQNFEYSCSLNSLNSNYIGRVLSRSNAEDKSEIWIEELYPELVQKAANDGKIVGVSQTIYNNGNIGNYAIRYQTPITPYIVSEVRGNKVLPLFRFTSISDGTNANREIKISIQNIRPDTKEFDVVIRQFNDTDTSPILLEEYRRCTLNKGDAGYIMKRIGDGLDYQLQSRYVIVEMYDENVPEDAFPAGFYGYSMKNYGEADGIKSPIMEYRTQYFEDNERPERVYLGISENAFDSDNFAYAGSSLDADRFNYNSETITTVPSSSAATKGFHMDRDISGTTDANNFVATPYLFKQESDFETDEASEILQSLRNRKFTLTFAGGFDGWDIYRQGRTNSDNFRKGRVRYDNASPGFGVTGQLAEKSSDYYAWLEAMNLFRNTESVPVNLIATPGIDYANHNSLVKEMVDIVENDRADSLYVMTSPDLPDTVNYANDIANAFDLADIDSSYVATYAPWVQVTTTDNILMYVPPTAEVFKNIAITDNRNFPWFAVGGLTRGVMNVRRVRKQLSQTDRDTLTSGRINPIGTFRDGIFIFGNRTTQIRESALQQISVRRLMLQAQRLVVNAVRVLLFEPNDEEFETEFLRIVNPILREIQDNRGISRFEIVTEGLNNSETRARRQFFGQIYLVPIGAVEQIILDFNVTPEGFNFSEV
jgi:hypothetical protein